MDQTQNSEPFIDGRTQSQQNQSINVNSEPRQPNHVNKDSMAQSAFEEQSTAMNIAELQMMATQAQSTANFTQKSIQEIQKPGTIAATTQQTFKEKDDSLERRDPQLSDAYQNLDSIQVGHVGIGAQVKQHARNVTLQENNSGQDIIDQTPNRQKTGMPNDEGAMTTDRFLKPKYSQRKNQMHLHQARDSRKKLLYSSKNQDQERLAATQMQSMDGSSQQLHNLLNDSQGQRSNTNSKKQKSSAFSKHKKNSVDYIQLKNLVSNFDSQSETNHDQDSTNFINKSVKLGKGGLNKVQSSKRSLMDSVSDKTSKLLLEKRQKAEARSRQQQILKPQVFDAPVNTNGSHKLPTLPRNESHLQHNSRNSSSLAQIDQFQQQQHSAQEFDVQALARPKSRTRSSAHISKQAKASYQHFVSTSSVPVDKQKHVLQFPDVSSLASGTQNKLGTAYLNSTQGGSAAPQSKSDSPMLINDYQNQEKQQQLQQRTSSSHMAHTSGFNKINFKSNEPRKKTQPRHSEIDHVPSVKKQLMGSQNSAIRIVKRQNNKFSFMENEMSPVSYASKFDLFASEPHKVYNGHSQTHISQRKLAPQSALMQQLLVSSTKREMKSHLSSTDKLHLNENSTMSSQLKAGDSVFKLDQGSLKRIRAAQEQITLQEIEITNAQNENKMTPRDVDQLLMAYISSLQNTIFLTNAKHTNLSTELQQFVGQCITGVQKCAQMRQRLLDEQIEKFDKNRGEYEQYIAKQDTKIAEQQFELDQRPFQKHFVSEEELAAEIEEQRKLAEEKIDMDAKVESSKYSGAQNHLSQLQRVFNGIQQMGIHKMSCSYIDQALFTEKATTVDNIGKEIKDEGSIAIRHTAKRVLDNFWRYYTTADRSTQTEEKVIDSLKQTIYEQKEDIKNLKRAKLDLENLKIELEGEVNSLTALNKLTKQQAKEKEQKIEDLESGNQKFMLEIQELKAKEKGLVDRFKSFTEEITGLKLHTQQVSDQLRSTMSSLMAKDAVITQLKKTLTSVTATGITVEAMDRQKSSNEEKNHETLNTEEDVEDTKKKQRGSSSKPRKQSATKGKGKKGKKGMKRDASNTSAKVIEKDEKSKSPKNKSRMAADVVDTQTEEKLKRRFTAVLREELVEEAEAQIRQQLKDAKDAADAEKQSKESLQRRTEKKIKALEDQVEEKDQEISDLKTQLAQAQQPQQPQVSIESRVSTQGNEDVEGESVERQPSIRKRSLDDKNVRSEQSTIVSEKVKNAQKKYDAKKNRTTIETTKNKSPTSSKKQSNQKRDSAAEPSAMNSSQFSIQLMNPTLDNNNAMTPNPVSDQRNISSKEVAIAVSESTLQPVVESQHERTAGHVLVSTGQKRSPKNQPQNLTQRNKDLSKSPNVTRKASMGFVDNQLTDGQNRNSSNATMQTGPKRGKSRKVSQGSQVEKSMLQASTVYNEEALQDQKEDTRQGMSDLGSQAMTNQMSIQMLEKYDGQITPDAGQTLHLQGNLSPSIVNIPIDSNQGRSYNDPMGNSYQDVDGQSPIRDEAMSNQTLYKQVSTTEDLHSAKQRGRQSVMKLIHQNSYQKLNRPKVDLPRNLAIESMQYQQRRATSFVNIGSKSGQNITMLSTNRLDQRVLDQGDKMLQEHLGNIQITNNRKLEKFQHIVNKAYGPKSPVSARILLEQAKEHLESSELKILMLMLQMRGQFDRTGGPMQSKSCQTEGVLINKSTKVPKRKSSTRDKDTNSIPQITNLRVNSQSQSQGDFTDANYQNNMKSQKLLHEQPELIEEGEKLDQATCGHVTVSRKMSRSNRGKRRRVADFGVQVGDDLIKVSMDRVKLIDQNKHMFYGSDNSADGRIDHRKHHSSAEAFVNMDGTFSPMPKPSAQLIKMRQEMFGDDTSKDRIMQPSLKQQMASREFQERQRIEYELARFNQMRGGQPYDHKIMRLSGDQFKAISVDLQNVMESTQRTPNSQDVSENVSRPSPSMFNLPTIAAEGLAEDTSKRQQQQLLLQADQSSQQQDQQLGLGSVASSARFEQQQDAASANFEKESFGQSVAENAQ